MVDHFEIFVEIHFVGLSANTCQAVHQFFVVCKFCAPAFILEKHKS